MGGRRLDLADDFRDLLRTFVDREVRFLVVGAYALAVLGRPRATGDLDVWIEPTRENAERVYAALREFGAPLHELTLPDGHLGRGVRRRVAASRPGEVRGCARH